MRCDDDYVWGGGKLHGAYDPDATPDSRALDFLVFCLCARRHGVVPVGWPWPDFMQRAESFVTFAFEKSDAQARWGGENVFSGRSLRRTAIDVLGSGPEYGAAESAAYRELAGAVLCFDTVEEVPEALLSAVGGVPLWRTFRDRLREKC